MYCRMIATVRVVNTSVTSHSYPFLVCDKDAEDLLSQVYEAVLLTVVTVLYARPSELTRLTTTSVPFDQHLSFLCAMEYYWTI